MVKAMWILAFVALSACGTTDKRKEEARLRLSIGSNLLANGSYHAALQELLNAERADPENVVIQNNLGLTYLVLNHPQVGLTHAQKAVTAAPQFSEARNNLARIQIELGRYDEAIRNLELVLKDLTYQTPEKAWVNIGLARFTQRQFNQALSALRRALEIDRNNCLAYNYFGRSQLELGRFAEAAQTLDQASRLCQQIRFDEPQYFSAMSYYKLGKREQALARLDELLTTFPHGKYSEKASEMRNLVK